ncbi:MAG: DUF1361 domain-containing protein [Bacteroidota bacterium]
MRFLHLSRYDRSFKVVLLLFAMSAVCCLLVAFRILYTDHTTYRFLIWNLFLAWIPLLAAYGLRKVFSETSRKWLSLLVLGGVWLVFLPNSPYIFTDLVHLEDRRMSGHDIHILFDATLIFAFALTGLIAGFVSLYWVHKVLDQLFHHRISWVLIACILVLTGYGVYLGRVVRWNSWDILVHPRSLLWDVLTEITHYTAFSLTALFSAFLLFCYLTLHSFIHISQNNK